MGTRIILTPGSHVSVLQPAHMGAKGQGVIHDGIMKEEIIVMTIKKRTQFLSHVVNRNLVSKGSTSSTVPLHLCV